MLSRSHFPTAFFVLDVIFQRIALAFQLSDPTIDGGDFGLQRCGHGRNVLELSDQRAVRFVVDAFVTGTSRPPRQTLCGQLHRLPEQRLSHQPCMKHVCALLVAKSLLEGCLSMSGLFDLFQHFIQFALDVLFDALGLVKLLKHRPI